MNISAKGKQVGFDGRYLRVEREDGRVMLNTQLQKAADALLEDYISDKELTAFTVLDFEMSGDKDA